MFKVEHITHVSRMPKVSERIIFNQINKYIDPFLSKLLTGFRKNHNTQHCLSEMPEKWEETLDKGNFVDANLPGSLKSVRYPKP